MSQPDTSRAGVLSFVDDRHDPGDWYEQAVVLILALLSAKEAAEQARDEAQAALRELVAAGDYSVTTSHDIKAMLRFDKATDEARTIIASVNQPQE